MSKYVQWLWDFEKLSIQEGKLEVFDFLIQTFLKANLKYLSQSFHGKPNGGFTLKMSRILEHSFSRYLKNSFYYCPH